MLKPLLIALALCCVSPGLAFAEPVAPPLRAAILLRSLGYERGVMAGQGPLLLVIVSGADGTSKMDAREMMSAFQALSSRMKIGDRAITLRTIEHRATADTQAQLRALAPAAVYFARGLEPFTLELTVGAEVAHWVPMCADGAALGAGCSVGVRALADASQLVIDLKRAHKAQLSFDPRMLRLAQVLQ